MKRYSIARFCIICKCLVAFSCTMSRASMLKRLVKNSGPKILKVKLYQGDTLMLVWYDTNGDGTCDFAELYEKEDGYFVITKFQCDQADEWDAYILEPSV